MTREAAKFLVFMREKCKTSQTALNTMIKGVTQLTKSYIQNALVCFLIILF